MREAQFNTEVINSLKAAGAWCYKIPDSPVSWTMRQTRFCPPKPCDIVGCFNGRFLAIEGKQMKKYGAFGLRQLRPNQIEALNQVKAAGGFSYVFLNVRIKKPQANRLYIFYWPVYQLIWEKDGPTKKKELEKMSFVDGQKGIFPLSYFLAGVC